MTHYLHRASLVALFSTAALLSACMTTPDYEGVAFLRAPEDVSSVWLAKDGALFLVPEKGVLIDRVVDDAGQDVELFPSGAYLMVPAARMSGVKSMRLLIEKRWRAISTSNHS